MKDEKITVSGPVDADGNEAFDGGHVRIDIGDRTALLTLAEYNDFVCECANLLVPLERVSFRKVEA